MSWDLCINWFKIFTDKAINVAAALTLPLTLKDLTVYAVILILTIYHYIWHIHKDIKHLSHYVDQLFYSVDSSCLFKKPFTSIQDSSVLNYKVLWQQFVLYLLWTQHLLGLEARGFTLNTAQEHTLDQLTWVLLQSDIEDSMSTVTITLTQNEDDISRSMMITTVLQTLLQQLEHMILCERTVNNPGVSSLMHFLSTLTWNSEHSVWSSTSQFHSILSQVVYLLCIVTIEDVIPLNNHDKIDCINAVKKYAEHYL